MERTGAMLQEILKRRQSVKECFARKTILSRPVSDRRGCGVIFGYPGANSGVSGFDDRLHDTGLDSEWNEVSECVM